MRKFIHIGVLLLIAVPACLALPQAGALRQAPKTEPETKAARPSANKTPQEILAAARILYIRSRSAFLKSETLANALWKRSDFQQSALIITKDEREADLLIQVNRAIFTTGFPFEVIDFRTQHVIASGKVNSFFGTAAGKIADSFMKRWKKARAPADTKSKK